MMPKNYQNVYLSRRAWRLVQRFWTVGVLILGLQVLAYSATERVWSSVAGDESTSLNRGTLLASAQAFTISGEVTDETGNPVPGVNVLVKGTTKGTTTDANGHYTIDAGTQDVLVFSFIGYATQEVAVNGRSEIDVELAEDVRSLDAVVVTALGIKRQPKELVYATQSVEPAQLAEIRDPNNILNSFQGRIANALITQSSGGLGSGARIVLRGNRSIDGDNNALIVVDGIPTSNITSINPDDIESITVLRGASAAALYGSQAGNGVIVITTKKGKEGQVSVSVNSGITLERPFALPRVQNTYGQGNAGVLDPTIGNSWGEKMTGQTYTNLRGEERSYSPQPDNIKDFFNTGSGFHNSIGISGGSEKMQTYLSYTNNRVEGIIPKNELTSHTVNLRLSNQVSDRFSTDAKVTYFHQDIANQPRSGEGNTPVLNAYQIPRNVSIADAKRYQTTNDLGIPVPAPWPATLGPIYGNPYWTINHDVHDQSKDHVFGFLSAKYKITDWLSLTGRANVDQSFVKDERMVSQGTLLWATRPGGYYSKSDITDSQKWFDAIFEGNNSLGENFAINYHAGAIYQDRQTERTDGIANGLNVTNKFSLNFATDPQISSSGTHVQTQSVFGQFNLSFKNSLFLEGSVRNDWDSRLPSPYSFQYYSIGSSAILSDMLTLPDMFSFLKVNVNYAEVGNGGQFALRSSSYSYEQGAGNGYLSRSPVLPIPGLKPEIVKSKEVGLEARFLQNKFGIALTYYNSHSLNQLLTISLPAGTGYSSQYINAGDVQNNGLEIVLNAMPVMNQRFEWSVDFNLAFNRNKVIELSDDLQVVYLGGYIDFGGRPQIEVGGSYGDILAHQWMKNDEGQYLVTDTGTPLTTLVAGERPGVIGNFNPKATLGLSNTFTYKGFSLRALIDGRVGGVMVSGTEQNLAASGITEGTEAHREGGWNLHGVDTEGQPVSEAISAQDFWQTASGKRFGVGEFFAYDITSFRFRELSLGYSIHVPSQSFVKKIRVSLVGRNLFWIYRGSSILDIPGLEKRKMWFDPDISLGNGNNFQGVEYGAFPSTRSLGIDLNLTI